MASPIRNYDFQYGGDSGVTDLVSRLVGIQRQKQAMKLAEEEAARRDEETARRNQILADQEALRKAQLRTQIAAGTDLTTAPQVEKQVTEGVTVSPEEAAYMGGAVTPGFKPKETVTTSVPNVPRTAPITYGGEQFNIPLQYKQDVEAEAEAAADRELERKQREDMVYIPEVGMVNRALVPLFSARERAGNKQVERSIDLGGVERIFYTDGTTEDVPRSPSPKAPTEEGALSAAQDRNLRHVTTNFSKDPVVGKANMLGVTAKLADTIISNPSSAVNQLSALYTLVKALDPDSAVREGELDLANATRSYWQSIQDIWARTGEGRVIHPEAAKNLALAAKQLAEMWRSAAAARAKTYSAQAAVLGVGPQFEDFMSNAGPHTPPPVAPAGDFDLVEVAPGVKKRVPRKPQGAAR